MASTNQLAGRRSLVATVILLLILLLLALGLALLNFFLRQPTSFTGEGEGDRNFLFSIYGFEGDLLRRPTNVAVDGQGNIHVVDSGKRRIVVFDRDGRFVAAYGTPGDGETELRSPVDVAVAADGRAYVVDKTLSKIVIYDSTRQPVRAIQFADEPPLSVTIAGDELVVTTGSGVVIGNLDGEFQTGYVARGKEPGQFDRPSGVAVGDDGTLYVCDALNYRIQAIGTDGAVKWTYGEPIPEGVDAIRFDDETRKFGLPASITIDENGYLYIVDGLNAEVVVLESATGELIEEFGDVGSQDGAFYYPDGIEYGDGRLVIADMFNDRVQVFRVPVGASALDTLLPLAPWLLLIPLALLALIPLTRRRRVNVVTREFAASLAVNEHADEIVRSLKRVVAAPELADEYEETFEGLKWVSREVDADRVKQLAEQYQLSPENAEALDIAIGAKGRKVLLSDDPVLARAASEHELTIVTLEEILAALGQESEATEGEA